MAARPPERRSSFRAQVLAIVSLAVRQKRNQFSRPRSKAKGLRTATAHKSDRKWLVPLLLGLMMLGVSTNAGYQAVHGLARHAKQQWPAGWGEEAVIEVGTGEYLALFTLAGDARLQPGSGSDAAGWRKSMLESLAKDIQRDRKVDEVAAREEARRLAAHLDKHGIEGFVREGRGSPYRGVDFNLLSAEARGWLGRVLALVFGCLLVGITLMPLSVRTKDLGSLDAQLEWLFSLPLSGGALLSGRFLAMTLVRPMGWIIFLPFCGVIGWAMGYGPAALLIGFAVTLALSMIATGFELAIETWLRSGASFRIKKNIQSAATVVGTLAFFTGMGAGFAGERSAAWVGWILGHTPAWLTAVPGRLIMLPLEGWGGLLLSGILLVVAVLVCGFGGWLLAARALKRGLESGGGREGSRTAGGAVARSTSLARFEWLLLLRDRNLAVLVLVMPLLLVGYQMLINPDLFAVASAQKLAVLGFGCGIWAAIMTAPHVVGTDINNMWLVFSLPLEVAEYFRRRTRVWRSTGIVMTAAVMLALGIWKGGMPAGDWWRIPAALAGVWVVSLVVYAIMMGGARPPDPSRPGQPRVGMLRVYACMIIGAGVGMLLWHGGPWQVISGLVVWWFFGFGLWSGVVRKLRYLLEPTDKAPAQLTVAHALVAVIVFFAVQAFSSMAGLLVSYTVGGLAASAYCAISLSNHSLPKAPREGFNPAVALLACILVCSGCAALWLAGLRVIPPLRELHQAAQAQAAAPFDLRGWQAAILLVVAAPLIEEFLFRGYVLRIMQTVWSPAAAVLASALLFAVVHPGLSFPPVFVLGMATGWLYHRSQRLWPGMVLHVVYNAVVLAMH